MPYEWIFKDAVMHPDNPMFECPLCHGLTFVPTKECQNCRTQMYIPKDMQQWVPEKYRHIWEDDWNLQNVV